MKTLETQPGLDQEQNRDQDPESIKEDQVDPQVERVGRVQVRTAQQPIRTEGHPAAVQLAHAQRDLQEVSETRFSVSTCPSLRADTGPHVAVWSESD